MRALYAYFMTRTPVHAPAQANGIPFPFNISLSAGGVETAVFRPGRFDPDVTKNGMEPRRLYRAGLEPLRSLPYAA
jgi:hypothetical protein